MKRIRLRKQKSKMMLWLILALVILALLIWSPWNNKESDDGQKNHVGNNSGSNMTGSPMIINDEIKQGCDQKVVVETFEVPVQIEQEFERTVRKNRTIVPEFEVVDYLEKKGEYYFDWEYGMFSEFIENLEISGWSDTKEADFTSISDGKNLASGSITVRNKYGSDADFTVRRFFSLKQKEYFLDDQNSITKTVDDKEEFVFDKGIICYYIRDGDPEMSDFVEFLDFYKVADKDAVVFGKNGMVWGCIRARYQVSAVDIVQEYSATETYTSLVNRTIKKLFNRIVTDC